MRNSIIFMLGPPATGKSTIGARLAESLQMPYFSKDGVKEPIFDEVGCPVAMDTDEPLSGRKMNEASFAIVFYLIEELLKAGCPAVIDCNFRPDHADKLGELIKQYGTTPLQILCTTEESVLAGRFEQRANFPVRHPGHLDKFLSAAFDMEQLQQTFGQPLAIGGQVLKVDSTHFSDDEFHSLLLEVEKLISRTGSNQ